ncbi:hypothetical protein [Pseudoalteromonas phenolica]|uniref:CHASE2 domain-containing protein n=2 Tax=Pseudoalteromonas phenolica TaxID=161398 RepID=A0A0S2K0D3_9GAMM|nr:hypothetical protein [Pseudoalteromonas phenolica]ALO41535.1 hypothetical protein PP2015_1017 [Pseudoalteromonas phenolica]MBE0353919.1 hypothetical protein [Pseudoalteromonas phenolica O-BC30]
MSIKQQLFFVKRHKTFWLIITLIAFVLLAELSGALQRLNAPVYNYFSQLQSEKHSDVVVIEADALVFEHDQLVYSLLEHNPKAIIVVSDSKLTHIEDERVFYPRPENNLCLSELKAWLGYTIQINHQKNANCDSLWSLIFPENNLAHSPLLSFALDIHALPKFNSKRVQSNDLLAGQVTDKLILISQTNQSFGLPIRAPKLVNEVNSIYIHAYVAHNLIEKTLISPVSDNLSLIIQLTSVILLLVLYQKVSFNLGIIVASLLSLTWLVLCFFVMTGMNIFLPAAEGVILNFITLFWVFLSAKWVEEDDLKRLINNIRQKMSGRYLPKSFTDQSTPWDSIIQLINQQLALDKSILLARLEGDHRLYEIRAINCHLSDIHEMRRDYERAPYSDAIKAFGTVKITRPFFKALEEKEAQYIVPLMYAGDIRGFWAMTITPDERFNEAAFIKNVNRFANQVGELLFHYRVFETQGKAESNAITRLLTLNLAKPLSQQIKHSINEMEQKLTTLEHVFNQIRSASVLFNLFGQVVQTNHALEQLAKQHHLPIFEMTALDLLCKVSDLDHENAKGKLRYLTLHKGEIYLPVQLAEQQFVLNVRTIESSEEKSSAGEPFEVGGILFEFINLSELMSQIHQDDDKTGLLSDNNTEKHNNAESEASN